MRNRDRLLVLAVVSLSVSAALLSQRGPANWPAWWISMLSLPALGTSLLAWARWMHLAGPAMRARALVLNGAASLIAASLWVEFALAELYGLRSPLRWGLAIALAWMGAPFLALALTRLARRAGR